MIARGKENARRADAAARSCKPLLRAKSLAASSARLDGSVMTPMAATAAMTATTTVEATATTAVETAATAMEATAPTVEPATTMITAAAVPATAAMPTGAAAITAVPAGPTAIAAMPAARTAMATPAPAAAPAIAAAPVIAAPVPARTAPGRIIPAIAATAPHEGVHADADDDGLRLRLRGGKRHDAGQHGGGQHQREEGFFHGIAPFSPAWGDGPAACFLMSSFRKKRKET